MCICWPLLSTTNAHARPQRNSPNKYIKNCDFSYRMNANGGPFTDFTVTSVLGHLTSNDFPAEYRKWHSCDPYQLLDAPIMTYVSEVGCPCIVRAGPG